MSVANLSTEKQSAPSSSITSILTRIILLCAIDGFAIWFALNLFANGVPYLAITIIVIAAITTYVVLAKDAYPIRWMMVGLAVMILFAIYPILFTVYVAFTNFGDGHLLSKEQAIAEIQKKQYLPEEGNAYTWTGYINENNEFALWLQSENTAGLLALPNQPLIEASTGESGVGELDADGIPLTIDGYTRQNRLQLVRFINELGGISFGADDRVVQVRSLDDAAELVSQYVYDATNDTFTDNETGTIYQDIEGTYTAANGEFLRPGFQAVVGFANFQRFFQSSALQGPLFRIITWNFAFAFLSVFTTFSLGLTIAYVFNDPEFPGRKIIQSFLLIPYTIPSLITILIWRGLMNQEIGIINQTLTAWFGTAPPWTTDQWWAKIAILIINLWLGYPYFMLICSGALQAIPQDIYAAAEVDGANAWQRFRQITLPLLLVAVGPLLVASFTFNFNNFNLIFLFTGGGPAIANSAANAGHTDILISYVYKLAFAGGRGADYGLASAITIIIFFIVAIITLFQFRYTQMWEEVGESV
jgi:ABC-type sugar transport system permease subunit